MAKTYIDTITTSLKNCAISDKAKVSTCITNVADTSDEIAPNEKTLTEAEKCETLQVRNGTDHYISAKDDTVESLYQASSPINMLNTNVYVTKSPVGGDICDSSPGVALGMACSLISHKNDNTYSN